MCQIEVLQHQNLKQQSGRLIYSFSHLLIQYIYTNTQPISMSQFVSSFSQNAFDQDHGYLSESFNKETMTVTYIYPDRLIQVANGIVLHVKNIVQANTKFQASAMIQYQNGYPLLVPIQYKSVFEEIFVSTSKIAYTFKSCIDNFTICLKLNLKLSNSNNGFDDQEEKLLQQALIKLRQSLIFAGMLKCRNKLSLQILKQSLKLKKTYGNAINKNSQTNQQYPNNLPLIIDVQQNNFNQIKSIKQVQTDMVDQKEEKSAKNGGYFCVQKRYFDIVHADGSQTKNKKLAFKRMRNSRSKEYNKKQKQQIELDMVKKIQKNKYMVNYYAMPNVSRPFYMDYIQKNLKEHVFEEKLKIKEILDLTKQIVEAVQIVHKSGVVHRDLKLQNIMVEQKNGEKSIKLIDFGESALIDVPYSSKHILGCTVPYSPIECLLDSFEGFNRPEIDYWSLIVVIYQLAFKDLPIYYNRNIQPQIMSGWKTQGDFNPFLNLRPKKGIKKIQEIFSWMAESGLKISQKQRLHLKYVYEIVQGIQTYYNELVALMKNN